jgi:hypothetical protein
MITLDQVDCVNGFFFKLVLLADIELNRAGSEGVPKDHEGKNKKIDSDHKFIE